MSSTALEDMHEIEESDPDEGVMYDAEDLTTQDTDFDDGFTLPIAHYYESHSDMENGVTQQAHGRFETLQDSSKPPISYRPSSHTSDCTTTAESTIAHQGSTGSSPPASVSSDDEDANEEEEEDHPIGSDHEVDQEDLHQSSTSIPVRWSSSPQYKLGGRYTPMPRSQNAKAADENKSPVSEVVGFRPASAVLKEMKQSAPNS